MVVQKLSASVKEVGVAHVYQTFINSRFQVSVKINEVLLYNNKPETKF